MTHHSVNNNTRMGLAISLCCISLSKFKSFDQLIPPKLLQILDIYSVVALVPQLSKCLKFQAVWGVLNRSNDLKLEKEI